MQDTCRLQLGGQDHLRPRPKPQGQGQHRPKLQFQGQPRPDSAITGQIHERSHHGSCMLCRGHHGPKQGQGHHGPRPQHQGLHGPGDHHFRRPSLANTKDKANTCQGQSCKAASKYRGHLVMVMLKPSQIAAGKIASPFSSASTVPWAEAGSFTLSLPCSS